MATVTMTKAQVAALDELLDYIAYDEEKHYDGDPKHIYRAIYVLAKMRNLSVLSPEEMDMEMAQGKEAAR